MEQFDFNFWLVNGGSKLPPTAGILLPSESHSYARLLVVGSGLETGIQKRRAAKLSARSEAWPAGAPPWKDGTGWVCGLLVPSGGHTPEPQAHPSGDACFLLRLKNH